MREEQNIVKGKYLRSCWNKIILILSITLLFVMCVHKTNERYEDMLVDSTWQSPFVAMNIEYKDSVYSIVPREGDMYLFQNNGLADKKYRHELFPIILEQTLSIDSITFCSLKEMDCMVTSQSYIDSIYEGKVENLLSLLFNKRGVLSVSLSYPEEKYLIYLLFQHGVYLNTDCETGTFYILNK
ncbi:hypothetical protein [Bacteroides sp.]|uniref:hypothetical protein n=1 Tax=Bacteroides sp. TaxID=29523 RepID=UPI003AB410F0